MEVIKIEFTPKEIEALGALLDAGVRSVGLRSVKEAAALLVKIEAAVEEKPQLAEQIKRLRADHD